MKKTSTLAFLLLLAAAAIYCQDRAKTAEPLEKTIRLKTFIYIDQQGTGIEAFRMLMPSDWQFEGGINWTLDNPSMLATASFQVRNPKGREEFEAFPNQPFFWTNSLGEYILSDKPNFNPNVGSNLNWQSIKKK
jgi:hypothetical protein